MEALWAKALAEGEEKEEEAVEEPLKEEKESTLKIIGVVDQVSPSKKGKHFVLHWNGRTYSFKCVGANGVMTYVCIKKNTPDVMCLGYIKCLKEDENDEFGLWIIFVRPCSDHPLDNSVVKRKEFIKELKEKSNSVDAIPSKIVTSMMEHMTPRERLKLPNQDSLRRIASAQKRKLLPSVADNPKSKTLIGRQIKYFSLALGV